MRHGLLLAGVHPDAIPRLPFPIARRMLEAAMARDDVRAFMQQERPVHLEEGTELAAIQDDADEAQWGTGDAE